MSREVTEWGWRTYLVGALVAIGVGATYAAAVLGGDKTPTDLDLTCSSSQVVFEQKKRCGFVDLGELVAVTGCVIQTKTHKDGDFSINLKPDEEFQHLLYYQGRKTRKYLHIEFMPCEQQYGDVARVIQDVKEHYESEEFDRYTCSLRVGVLGRWAYDGVDHRGTWRDQLGNCLNGRGVDPAVGWTEIHPAYTVEILKQDL